METFWKKTQQGGEREGGKVEGSRGTLKPEGAGWMIVT